MLQLGREFLVGDDRRRGQVPHAQLRGARFAQGTVRVPAISSASAVIHRGPQQRVAEPHRGAGKRQHAGLGHVGRGRIRVDAGLCRRAPQPAPLTGRVGRDQQRERLGVWRQAAYLAQEVVLEPLAQRKWLRQAGAAGELVGRVLGTEFHQRERIVAGIGQDAVDRLRGQGSASHRAEQLTGLGVGQAIHRDRRKLLEHLLGGRLAYASDEADAVRMQAAGNETEHLRRFGIQPVRVINNAQQRLGLSRPGKQRERRQSHQEPLRRRPCLLTESDPQRAPLRRRQLVQLRQARDQQLMQATERHADL